MKNKEDYYTQYLERYKRDTWELRKMELFVSLFSSKRNDIILDAGCGAGAYSHHLLKKRNVISADVSIEALKIGKERYRFPHPICCDILKLPFRDDSFNKIILVEVVEHIKKQSALFSELRRVLRVRGILFVTTSPIKSHILLPLIEKASRCEALHKIFHFYTTGDHVAIQHPRTLKKNLEKRGFEIAKEKYWNTLHLFHFLTLINIHILPFAFAKRLSNLFTVFDGFFDNIYLCNDMIVSARKSW